MPRRYPQCFGHAGMAHRSLHRVQAGDEFWSFRHRLLQAPPGDAQDVGESHAHQGFGGGEWHRPWHVAHGVVLHAVDGHGGIAVGRLLACGDAAALVDGPWLYVAALKLEG